MKHVTARSSDHKEDGNHDTPTATTTAPFAENRYRKYRFEHESIVTNAPESSGVYGLYRAFWIFIGEAENIRTRLLDTWRAIIHASTSTGHPALPSNLCLPRIMAADGMN